MAQLCIWSNNSVTAVVTEEVYQENQRRQKLAEEAVAEGCLRPILLPVRPVFTFSDASSLQCWVTGTMADLEVLLKGHLSKTRPFYVPFSNGYETGIHGPELQRQEWSFHTTLGEAMETFGLVRAPRKE